MRVERPTSEDQRWKNFIGQFASANIFHSPEMVQVFSISEGYDAFPLLATSGQEVVAAAFPVLVGTDSMLPRSFTGRLIMYSTPLYVNDPQGVDGVELILKYVEAIAHKNALFMEVRNTERFPGYGKIQRLDAYEYIPYQNYVLDLTVGSDNLWNSLSTYTRNHIRKSERKGVVVRAILPSELDQVLDLLARLYHRKRVPLSNPSIFKNTYKFLTEKGLARFIVADLHSRIIGARISLNYAGTVYDWYAASDPIEAGYYPNEALTWDAIRWGSNLGYRLFDFGGAGIRGQDYGPAKFKEKFRGTLVEYGRYRYITHPLIYSIGRRLYELRTAHAKTGNALRWRE